MAGCASAKKQSDTAAPVTAKAPAVTQDTNAGGGKTEDDFGKTTCTQGEETRLLEITKSDAGCTLNYTKGGKAAAVSSAVHGTKHCVDSKNKIRTKLEAAGYTCT